MAQPATPSVRPTTPGENAWLLDPTRYVRIDAVPVFDEHEGFGREQLDEIVHKCNERERATGDLCPITIGHTLKEDPNEDVQPDVVGYARNYQLGRFGPGNKLAILADFYLRKDRYEEALSYPRRSVELWKSDKIIDPIALLRRTPQRDLGLLTFKKGGEVLAYERRTGRLVYALEHDMADTKNDWDEDSLPAEEHDKALMYFRHCLKNHAVGKHLADQYMKSCGADPVQHAAGAGGPSATSVTVPAMTPVAPAPAPGGVVAPVKPEEDGPEQLRRKEEAIRFQKQEEEKKALEARLAAMEQYARDAQAREVKTLRESEALQLIREGLDFDTVEHMKFVGDMSQEQYARYMPLFKSSCKKLPVTLPGRGLIPTEQPARVLPNGEQPSQYSRDQFEKARDHALSHNERNPNKAPMQLADALLELYGQGGKK